MQCWRVVRGVVGKWWMAVVTLQPSTGFLAKIYHYQIGILVFKCISHVSGPFICSVYTLSTVHVGIQSVYTFLCFPVHQENLTTEMNNQCSWNVAYSLSDVNFDCQENALYLLPGVFYIQYTVCCMRWGFFNVKWMTLLYTRFCNFQNAYLFVRGIFLLICC